MRPFSDFTDNERAVIRERHFGWERARMSALALIFGTSTNTIRRICRDRVTPECTALTGGDACCVVAQEVVDPVHVAVPHSDGETA